MNWTEIVERERLLKGERRKSRRYPSPAEIIEAACWMRGCESAQIRNWNKATKSAGQLTREWCVYALRKLTSLSFPEIAALFSMQSHSTIHHAWTRFVRDVDKATRDDGLNIIRQRAEYLAEINK